VSGRAGDGLALRLLATIVASGAAGVEEKTRGESAGDHGDQHGDDDEAAAGKYERQRIELHIPTIFASPRATQVGPKVTS
jgi:hypothetical protein